MKSKKGSAMLGKFLFYFGNTLIGIIFVSPLIWMISASFKPEAKIFANMNSLITFLPVDASFDNYFEVFRRINMANVFKNTLLYIALILVFDLLVNSICGYALAKFDFRGRKLMLSFIVALMVLPMEAILLPLYIEEGKLGLTIAIGCTGGHHRSVAIAAALNDYFCAKGLSSTNINRDVEK